MNYADAARIAHEVNRAYCESIGDTTQPEWSKAPDWQQTSAINGIRAHWTALASGRQPSPRESHDAWIAEKFASGWKFGPVKDAEKKEHPCIVPYDELPLIQRAKDMLFVAVAKATFVV